jgi:hypothetical protein
MKPPPIPPRERWVPLDLPPMSGQQHLWDTVGARPEDYADAPPESAARIRKLLLARSQCPEAEYAMHTAQLHAAVMDVWLCHRILNLRQRVTAKRQLAREDAKEYMRYVAPRPPVAGAPTLADISISLARGGCCVWSPDGDGRLRHDAPAHLDHAPRIVFCPAGLYRGLPWWRLPADVLVFRVRNDADARKGGAK